MVVQDTNRKKTERVEINMDCEVITYNKFKLLSCLARGFRNLFSHHL